MAEGGEYSSPVLGSDMIFEYTCTPCAEDGIIQESLKYCPECKEFLCETCVNHHKKVSATKKHKLQDNDFQRCEKGSVNNTSDEENMFKCLYHPDRDIEMYCGDHEMVFCALCVAKNHR
ncbi:transcription intermediary factor 1-beta-like [Ruditapes philippinarum]|uniref:transcription intermediary factor 1-beta-like n=1 Tax=Ruditapes philippinarum TaxID=129788 RepID=UPI00295AAC31|nr:transcription intermediary factor 1-beta-like [Ruditapes philippinarum]